MWDPHVSSLFFRLSFILFLLLTKAKAPPPAARNPWPTTGRSAARRTSCHPAARAATNCSPWPGGRDSARRVQGHGPPPSLRHGQDHGPPPAELHSQGLRSSRLGKREGGRKNALGLGMHGGAVAWRGRDSDVPREVSTSYYYCYSSSGFFFFFFNKKKKK